jgi:hypothetical protein
MSESTGWVLTLFEVGLAGASEQYGYSCRFEDLCLWVGNV